MSIEETLASREKTHGKYSNHARVTQRIKRILFEEISNCSAFLTDSQWETLDMIAHKIGRIIAGNPNEPDHWHDIAGYAELIVRELREVDNDVAPGA